MRSFVNHIAVLLITPALIVFAERIESRDEIIENIRCLVENNQPVIIYTVVALCDNENQGIVPVSAILGNGEDPEHNLYWGASYGVKTFFEKSARWELVEIVQRVDEVVLERCIFNSSSKNAYLVADAFRGREIKKAITHFLNTAAGRNDEEIKLAVDTTLTISISSAQLVCYVGHNGLMDFELDAYPLTDSGNKQKDAIILACASKYFFAQAIESAGVFPLLWTNGLLAPEAYTLEAAIEAWLEIEDGEKVRTRAASAYAQYQKCSIKAAKQILVRGW